MVKQLNIIQDDKDHQELLKRKGDQSWREFLLGKTK